MRCALAAIFAWTTLGAAATAATAAEDSMDWGAWRGLAVQDGGRRKPLDTLAWETLRTLGNRAGIADPASGRKLDSTAFYLALLFDWDGWDRAPDPHAAMGMAGGMGGHNAYFARHKPDKWDRAPLLRVDFLALREALGMAADQKHISPWDLNEARIRLPDTGRQTPFVAWAERLVMGRQEGLTALEKKGLELADKLWAYQQHRSGKRLEVLPLPGSEDQQWVAVAQLVRSTYNDQSDPTGALRRAKEAFLKCMAAYRADAPETFNEAAADFLAAVREAGPEMGPYPRQATIDLEVAYNHWAPFRFAWVFMLAATVFLLLGMGTRWRTFHALGIAAYAAGVAGMLAGFGLRIAISGRAPVTNMYESVVYLGLGTAFIGAVLELFYRRRFILAAAAAVSMAALVLADNSPAVLDASLHPLQPVLRNNFWLVTHVMTITLSYAAFALALGVGNIALGYYLVRSKDREALNALSKFAYKALQVGVLLLAIGTILGGVWADYSWGRFWGWDPKEVWALIALLGYLAVLHARYVGWVGNFGLASLSAICFSLVVMAWYGVNFVLGAGLHSYGFGGGGQTYVYGAVLVQFLYVGAAGLRYRTGTMYAAEEDSSPRQRTAVRPPHFQETRSERVDR